MAGWLADSYLYRIHTFIQLPHVLHLHPSPNGCSALICRYTHLLDTDILSHSAGSHGCSKGKMQTNAAATDAHDLLVSIALLESICIYQLLHAIVLSLLSYLHIYHVAMRLHSRRKA